MCGGRYALPYSCGTQQRAAQQIPRKSPAFSPPLTVPQPSCPPCRPNNALLSSRQQTCLNPSVSSLVGVAANRACRALVGSRACKWHLNVERYLKKAPETLQVGHTSFIGFLSLQLGWAPRLHVALECGVLPQEGPRDVAGGLFALPVAFFLLAQSWSGSGSDMCRRGWHGSN